MAYTTLAKINDAYVGSSVSIASGLIKRNTFMGILPFASASHGNKDKFRLYDTSPTVSRTNDTENYTPSALDPTLTELSLTMLGIVHQEPARIVDQFPVPEGMAERTSYEAYFAERQSLFLNALGKEFTERCFYGTSTGYDFEGIIPQATADSTVTDLGGGAGASTDIMIIRFDEENCHGLFNEKLVADNKLVDVRWTPSKGATQMVSNASGQQTQVYSAVYSTALGLKIASSGYVSAITGIDASNKPTIANIDKALRQAGQYLDRANTIIICSPLGYTYLSEVLGGDLRRYTSANIGELSTVVETYNGSMVIIDNNVSDAK